jgi:hypothetical protein
MYTVAYGQSGRGGKYLFFVWDLCMTYLLAIKKRPKCSSTSTSTSRSISSMKSPKKSDSRNGNEGPRPWPRLRDEELMGLLMEGESSEQFQRELHAYTRA